MPNTLSGMAVSAEDPLFRARVKAAMITAATAIGGESPSGMTTTVYQKRQALATKVLNEPEGYNGRFAIATATSTTVAAGVLAPVSISSSTNANPIAITTAAVHGLTSGDVVEITGHAVNTEANGCWVVTVTSTTVFTIPDAGIGVGAATGIVTKQPTDAQIQTAVNSVWNDIAGVTGTD